MRVGSLSRLVDTARSLPGDRKAVGGPVIPSRAGARPSRDESGSAELATVEAAADAVLDANVDSPVEESIDVRVDAAAIGALRKRVGALLSELSRRLEPALTEALVRASTAWDQFDAFSVLDNPLVGEGAAIRGEAARFAAMHNGAVRAAGVEMLLALDGALGLVALVERRLATLVRLRIRGADPELLPGGRPFLDVAAALAEAARAWA